MLHEIVLTVVALLSIASGVWSILLINRLNTKFKLPYLNTFLYYQILLFVFGIYGLLGMAIIDEILKTMNAPSGMIEAILAFLPFLGFPFLITAWYMFIKLSAELTEKKISGASTIVYFIFMLLLILGLGIATVYLIQYQPDKAINLTFNLKRILFTLDLSAFSVSLYYLYFFGRRIKNHTTKKMVISFAHISVIAKLIVSVLFYFASSDSVTGLLYILIFFSCNIPVILYLDHYLNLHFASSTQNKSINLFLQFIKDYKLSRREWEIIEEICEGMTNKEISDKLFISLQTVKDHCYKIYKKTGVRNRVELVNLVKSNKSN
jgi:DNA-binding CsgD family transcriptional regulator